MQNAQTSLPPTQTPLSPAQVEALRNQITKQQALIEQLQSEQEKAKLKPIEKPVGTIIDLADAMGLADTRDLYNQCRAQVRALLIAAEMEPTVPWKDQNVDKLARIAKLAAERTPQLKKYEGSWASYEIMRTILKYKRNNKSKRLRGPKTPPSASSTNNANNPGNPNDTGNPGNIDDGTSNLNNSTNVNEPSNFHSSSINFDEGFANPIEGFANFNDNSDNLNSSTDNPNNRPSGSGGLENGSGNISGGLDSPDGNSNGGGDMGSTTQGGRGAHGTSGAQGVQGVRGVHRGRGGRGGRRGRRGQGAQGTCGGQAVLGVEGSNNQGVEKRAEDNQNTSSSGGDDSGIPGSQRPPKRPRIENSNTNRGVARSTRRGVPR